MNVREWLLIAGALVCTGLIAWAVSEASEDDDRWVPQPQATLPGQQPVIVVQPQHDDSLWWWMHSSAPRTTVIEQHHYQAPATSPMLRPAVSSTPHYAAPKVSAPVAKPVTTFKPVTSYKPMSTPSYRPSSSGGYRSVSSSGARR